MEHNKLRSIADEFQQMALKGIEPSDFCFPICYGLMIYLQQRGVSCSLQNGKVNNINHYWLTVDGGNILDATIQQFKNIDRSYLNGNVYIGNDPLGIYCMNNTWNFSSSIDNAITSWNEIFTCPRSLLDGQPREFGHTKPQHLAVMFNIAILLYTESTIARGLNEEERRFMKSIEVIIGTL